tara:strand:+ start:2838 stop:3449 length:612 start_codon:yes stop_codon:yes gene_type:complete
MSDDKLDFTNKALEWALSNIKYIMIGVIAGVSIPLIWNYQQHLENEKNLVASDLYYNFISLENSIEEVENSKIDILKSHDGSIYEVLTKFILSKNEFENKNFELSKKYLEEIIEINANETYNSLAAIKISLIYVENKKYDDALKYLDNVKMKDSFKQILSEIKGDIYKYKGDNEKSLKFYNKAIESSAVDNDNLLMKRNSVKN